MARRFDMSDDEMEHSQSREAGAAHRSAVARKGGDPPAPHLDAGAMALEHDLQRLPLPLPDDVVDWVGFLRRQWLLMAAVWILVMIGVVVALFYWPRQYTSGAKFLVKNARQDLVVGPNESGGAMYREGVSEETLNTELELLRSWDILTKVVQDLELSRAFVQQGRPPEIAEELATQSLLRTLDASPIRKTNVVQVSYTSPDPQRSKDVVQHVADAYLAAHLTAHSSPGTYQLFKKQAEQANIDLRKAEEDLAGLARSTNLVLLDMQKQDALKATQDLETQLQALNAEMREHETRAKIAELHMSRTAQRVSTTRRNIPAQSSVEHLHLMIAELTNKRTQALTRFQPTDRLVVELDQQIADTSASLEQAKTLNANEESTDINPSWQALDAEQTKARLAYAGLESKAAQVKRELEDQRAKTLRITEAGPQYDAITRRIAEHKSNVELYSKKEEEARIAEVLDKQRISNVVLAQAPIVSHVPSKPSVRLGLVAGAILAVMIAVGMAFLRELFGVEVSRGRRGGDTQVAVLGLTPATAELPMTTGGSRS